MRQFWAKAKLKIANDANISSFLSIWSEFSVPGTVALSGRRQLVFDMSAMLHNLSLLHHVQIFIIHKQVTGTSLITH